MSFIFFRFARILGGFTFALVFICQAQLWAKKHSSISIRFDSKAHILGDDAKRLPVGIGVNTWLENTFLPAIVSNADTASFSVTERSYLNAYGSSVLWQRHYLDGLDITSPSDPGRAFFELPTLGVNTLRYLNVGSAVSAENGLQLQTFPMDSLRFGTIQYGFTHDVGGGMFFPKGVFDREPAQLWGAPEERRRFGPSHDISGVESIFLSPRFLLTVLAESILHSRKFISQKKYENSGRHTALITFSTSKSVLHTGIQYFSREQFGAEDMESYPNSLAKKNLASFLQWNLRGKKDKLSLGFGSSINSLGDREQMHYQRTLEDEINLRPWASPSDTIDFWAGANHLLRGIHLPFALISKNSSFIRTAMRYEHISQEGLKDGASLARTWNKAPLDVTIQTQDQKVSQNNLFLRSVIGEEFSIGSFGGNYQVGMNLDARFSSGRTIFPWQAVGSISMKWSFENKSQLFWGVKHEAMRLTFRDDITMHKGMGMRKMFRWSDANGNGIYEGVESGALQRVTGGARFEDPGSLSPPVYEEVHIGWQTNPNYIYTYLLQSTIRWQRNLLQVGYSKDFKPKYETLERAGSLQGSVYNRTDNYIGQERYVIGNTQKNAVYFSLEMQLIKHQFSSFWFMNLTGGAYLHLAQTHPGNDFYRNDIGVLSEQTSDKNGKTNLLARTDNDRGYHFKLILGFEPFEDFTITNILHYRDGVPVGPSHVFDGLNQGVVVAQDDLRGGGEIGIGRYVFFMSWDIRVRYNGRSGHGFNNWFLAMDVYNLNDFHLEWKEQFLDGNGYRDPVESIIPRTVRISGGIHW